VSIITPLVASNGSRRWNLWLETAISARISANLRIYRYAVAIQEGFT